MRRSYAPGGISPCSPTGRPLLAERKRLETPPVLVATKGSNPVPPQAPTAPVPTGPSPVVMQPAQPPVQAAHPGCLSRRPRNRHRRRRPSRRHHRLRHPSCRRHRLRHRCPSGRRNRSCPRRHHLHRLRPCRPRLPRLNPRPRRRKPPRIRRTQPMPPTGPGQVAMLIPSKPAAAAEMAGNNNVRPDTGRAAINPGGLPDRDCRRGFKARFESGRHESGWPLVIVSDHDGAPMVLVPGGTFIMGNDRGEPTEAPEHTVRLSTFYIDQHEVTNRQFRTFLEKSHYRGKSHGQSFVGRQVAGRVLRFARGPGQLQRRRELRPLGRQTVADRGPVGDGGAIHRTVGGIPGAISRPSGRGRGNSTRSTRS